MSTEIKKTEKITVKTLAENPNFKARFAEILGKNASAFISSVVQLSSTQALAECDPMSILACAMNAASLNLQVNPNLGQACIVPYNTKDGKKAQFQIMSKGLLQLALRSGQFETINVSPVFDGQLKKHDILTGEIEFENEKKSDKVIGFVAYFRLINGFKKSLYMTNEEINEHGKKYSKTFKSEYGAWKTNFDGMASKTVLKLLISRYAPLSVEMQQAVISDQSFPKTNEETLDVDFSYDDNATAIDIAINNTETPKDTKEQINAIINFENSAK